MLESFLFYPFRGDESRSKVFSVAKTRTTKDDWTFRRQKVIENREKLVKSYSSFLPPNSLKFLRSLDYNPRSRNPAKFNVIPKIHKSPKAIAAFHSYINRPISIFVDELVKRSIRYAYGVA